MRSVGLLLLCILMTGVVHAQSIASLESLPNCDYTQALGLDGLNVGAVVINFENGLGCIENFDKIFNVASVPKVFIAGAYYDWLFRGLISPTRYEFTRNYWMGGSNDCLREEDIGQRYTGEELIDYMINCSDNAATWMLMDAIGWTTVENYVASLGIEGIGQVVPYAEVDRRKLVFLDERWADVPRAEASRFYRSGITFGLEEYFTEIPNRPNRSEYARINQAYYEAYTSNTMTARALATYFLKLRADALAGGIEGLIATSIFDTMFFTQRQYSVQYLPGTVYVASKNGFDRGLLAEANLLFNSVTNRIPTGMVIVFAQYESLTENNENLPGPFGGRLNDEFRLLSPLITDLLYPEYQEQPVQASLNLSSVVLNQQSPIEVCWFPFFQSDFDPALVPILETCFRNLTPRITYPSDENLAMGIVLYGLNAADTRLVYRFTAPDGRRFSYQDDRRNVNQAAVYWFHPLDMAGQWQLDIYINLQHVYSDTIIAQR